MRPVNKGEHNDFSKYQDAQIPLRETIGRYCSYCEQSKELAVEHVVSLFKGGAELEWQNFLLGCNHCNGSSNKGTKNDSREGYYWADQHNTAYAFQYLENNTIIPNPNLTDEEKVIAKATIDLTGLNRLPNSENPPTEKDERWFQRQESWNKALESFDDWEKYSSDSMCRQIIRTATQHFSVWMTVFKDVPQIKLALIEKFRGTARECFDENGDAVERIERV